MRKIICFAFLFTNALFAIQPDVVKELFVAKYLGPIDQKEWESRGSNGQIITTYSNGVTVTASYRDGFLNGPMFTTFPHSQTPCTAENFENGVRVGITYYYTSGSPKREENILSKCGYKITTWYLSGQIQSVEEFYENRLNKAEYFAQSGEKEGDIACGCGARPVRDGYGKLLAKETFSNGHLARKDSFFPNGELAMSVPYSQGQVHGEVRTFNITGEPLAIEQWKNGFKEGLTTLFHNGAKAAVIPFLAGLKHGVEQHFQDEILVEEVTWRQGKKHGRACVYFDGEPHEQWFHENKKIPKLAYDVIHQGPTKNL